MCWDGANLDSPNHKAHMSYRVKGGCPASHPVLIPDITYIIDWNVNNTNNLRLSSDNYSGGASGESAHGDWVNGWDPKVMDTYVIHCLKAQRDCHGYLLGDGTAVY